MRPGVIRGVLRFAVPRLPQWLVSGDNCKGGYFCHDALALALGLLSLSAWRGHFSCVGAPVVSGTGGLGSRPVGGNLLEIPEASGEASGLEQMPELSLQQNTASSPARR